MTGRDRLNVGWGKIKSKWILYYMYEGERMSVLSAPLKTRALLASNLMELWGEIQIADEQRNAWITEAANAASDFTDYLTELE